VARPKRFELLPPRFGVCKEDGAVVRAGVRTPNSYYAIGRISANGYQITKKG